MRRLRTGVLAAAAALLAGGGVVGGCGESGKASLHTNGPTKAEATAYAQAVNLGPADVPGMVSVSLEGEHKKEGPSLTAACGLRESHVHVADVQSPTFRSGGNGGGVPLQEVKSDVEVVPTAALAEGKLAHIQADLQSSRARACLARVYGQTFARHLNKGRSRFSLGRTTVSALHPTVPRSFGMRIVVPFALTVAGRTIQTRVYVDGLGFINGPAGVSLVTTRFTYPVPTGTEQRLLSLLYSRAKA